VPDVVLRLPPVLKKTVRIGNLFAIWGRLLALSFCAASRRCDRGARTGKGPCPALLSKIEKPSEKHKKKKKKKKKKKRENKRNEIYRGISLLSVTHGRLTVIWGLSCRFLMCRTIQKPTGCASAASFVRYPWIVATQMLGIDDRKPGPHTGRGGRTADEYERGSVMLSAWKSCRALSGRGSSHDGQRRHEVEQDPTYTHDHRIVTQGETAWDGGGTVSLPLPARLRKREHQGDLSALRKSGHPRVADTARERSTGVGRIMR